jgi:cAMP phosphodiesterase
MQGSGGGPLENNTTAFLVRSVASGWRKGSILAVDAGVHLAAIAGILEKHKPNSADLNGSTEVERPVMLHSGPFAGLEIPNRTSQANAAYVVRHLIDACLLTHPHLDHISGFVVNTASLPGSRPKRIAALPKTIEALKKHIFNNVIWPNLSDENNGAGLVTYMRLVEGGSPALGAGNGKGYVEVCDGLGVKTWSISHGHCIETHTHRGSAAGLITLPQLETSTSPLFNSPYSPPLDALTHSSQDHICVYDSSAYFIRDISTGIEVLIFGDVEPDSISLSPRNKQVWIEAAPKIISRTLTGILIECSYTDSQLADYLFGHLAPRYLIEELTVLADEIKRLQKLREVGAGDDLISRNEGSRKSRRLNPLKHTHPTRSARAFAATDSNSLVSQASPVPKKLFGSPPQSPTSDSLPPSAAFSNQPSTREIEAEDHSYLLPLRGVKIIIVHMKDNLNDGPPVGETILEQLLAYEKDVRLGCEFIISESGQSFFF